MSVLKSLAVASFTLGLAFVGSTASAADLANGSGQTCEAGEGHWHFVNNQTGGAPQGTLSVCFDPQGCYGPIPADAVNRNTQHFNVTTMGYTMLTGASTNLPGRLVLSDYSCEDIKEPPPCDPKDPKCVY